MFMPKVKQHLLNESTPINPISSRILNFTQLEIDTGFGVTTADRILKIRKALGVRQPEFGKFAGVSKAAVCNWEKGKTKPQRDALLSLKKSRNISPEYITSGAGQMFLTAADQQQNLTDEEVELLQHWAILMPEDRSDFMRRIREQTTYISAVALRHKGLTPPIAKAPTGGDHMIYDSDLPDRNELQEYNLRKTNNRRQRDTNVTIERRRSGDRRSK